MKYNYYKILGISVNASVGDIKKAYRAKARKYHPDVNDSSNANQYFAVVNEAYHILSNPLSRKKYDLRLLLACRAARKQKRDYRKYGKRAVAFKRKNSASGESTHERVRDGQLKKMAIIYNLLFLSGVILGGGMLAIAGWFLYYAPDDPRFYCSLLAIPGAIFFHDGWKGLTWRKNFWLVKNYNRIKSLFSTKKGP